MKRSTAPAAVGAPATIQHAVQAIHAALAADPAGVVAIPSIAVAAGVPQRTLERWFGRAVGRSPHAYVLQLRLDAARRMLASGKASSVLDAALRHGFNHPGRFASLCVRAFGEPPSATLRAARAAPALRQSDGPVMGWIMLRTLAGDAAMARCATHALAEALCRHSGLALCDAEDMVAAARRRLYRLQGRVEANNATLQLVHPARSAVLTTWRESLRTRGQVGWADRAIVAVTEAIAADHAEANRRIPRHAVSPDILVSRARAVAMMPDQATASMVFDLLGEALHRDPAHAMAHALVASCHGNSANHAFTRDPDGTRALALAHAQRALALAPDDPDVLTMAGCALSLSRRLDEAEVLIQRSLALNPNQPAAWRRLGFIENFRGNGPLAVERFRRAYHAWPHGRGGLHTMFGLGVASFMVGDYPRSARLVSRVLGGAAARAWQHRFLAAAAMHCGAWAEAKRSLSALRHAYPELTLDRLRRSGVLAQEPLGRVLDGLGRAGLPPD